jgi:hypothetical protein
MLRLVRHAQYAVGVYFSEFLAMFHDAGMEPAALPSAGGGGIGVSSCGMHCAVRSGVHR